MPKISRLASMSAWVQTVGMRVNVVLKLGLLTLSVPMLFLFLWGNRHHSMSEMGPDLLAAQGTVGVVVWGWIRLFRGDLSTTRTEIDFLSPLIFFFLFLLYLGPMLWIAKVGQQLVFAPIDVAIFGSSLWAGLGTWVVNPKEDDED